MVDDNLLRVTRISVKKLFDHYSHDVPLHVDERVTIIHGPNGVGKTMLLRLTSALLGGKYYEFLRIPFEAFEVTLSDGSIFGVRHKPLSKSGTEGGLVIYKQDSGDVVEEYAIKHEQADVTKLALRIEQDSPWLSHVGSDRFIDRRTDEILSAYEVVTTFPEFLPPRLRRHLFAEPEWMQALLKRVGVHLVEAQRLFRFDVSRDWESRHFSPSSKPRYVETVKDYARNLQERISTTLTDYAKVSQALDQSFPERLLKGTTWSGLSVDALKTRMQDLEKKRGTLKRLGLIEHDAAYPFDVTALENTDDTQRTVMTLYVSDTERKLGVLDDLANRVDLLCENINKKFQHKTIRISKEKGFEAITPDGRPLELAALSSGEQHELVLLYDLLFRVRSNTLVLIDEPELSLHVTWQKSFLPDLLEIVSATRFDVVLATHSPFIVGDRTDLMTALEVNGGS